MNVVILDSAEDVAQFGALSFLKLIKEKPDAVLGLATGSTPILLYQELINAYRKGKVSFAKTKSFNLDEYLGLGADHPQSYRFFMEQHLFSHIDIASENTWIPSCESDDTEKVCRDYEEQIVSAGGIDLQLLGIGRNGHIGFNEPYSSFCSRTRVNKLSTTTLKDNARFFVNSETQPRYAITMGISTILDVNKIVLLATGEKKAMAVRAAIEGPVTNACPASALQIHNNTTMVLDKAAASNLAHINVYRRNTEHFNIDPALRSA